MHHLILALELQHLRSANTVVQQSLVCNRRGCSEGIDFPPFEPPKTTETASVEMEGDLMYDGVILVQDDDISPRSLRVELINRRDSDIEVY